FRMRFFPLRNGLLCAFPVPFIIVFLFKPIVERVIGITDSWGARLTFGSLYRRIGSSEIPIDQDVEPDAALLLHICLPGVGLAPLYRCLLSGFFRRHRQTKY